MAIVNGREEALKALRAGDRALESPSYAACHAGVGYYAALVAELKKEFPEFTFTLCCGDDPAIAHEAIRRGFTSIRCACSPAMWAKLQELSSAAGRP